MSSLPPPTKSNGSAQLFDAWAGPRDHRTQVAPQFRVTFPRIFPTVAGTRLCVPSGRWSRTIIALPRLPRTSRRRGWSGRDPPGWPSLPGLHNRPRGCAPGASNDEVEGERQAPTPAPPDDAAESSSACWPVQPLIRDWSCAPIGEDGTMVRPTGMGPCPGRWGCSFRPSGGGP